MWVLMRKRLVVLIPATILVIIVVVVWRSPDVDGLRAGLRCGLSRQDVTKLAAKHGLGDCREPKRKIGTPDYSCSRGPDWMAFWFKADGLVAYQYGSFSDGSDAQSGTASAIISLCP